MQPRPRMFTIGLLIGVAAVVIYQMATRKNPDDMSAMPAAETAFVQTAMHASGLWSSGANDLAKAAMPAARAAAICQALPSRTATGWTGQILRVDPDNFPDYNGRKTARIVIALTSRVSLATPAAPLLNNPNTMVEAGSPLYAAAAALPIGTTVVFSARFFPSDRDCIKETSVTEDGSMSTPQFKIQLTALAAAK